MREELGRVPFSGLITINPRLPLSGKTVPFVGMEDVSEDGQLLRIKERRTTELSSGQPTFRDGDVLFAKITPCMENGKGAYVAGVGERTAYGSTEFHVLRARSGVCARFLYQWTRSDRFRRAAEAMMTGSAGQRRVPAEFFHRYSIPDFALREQRQITEVLDSVDEQVNASEQCAKKLEQVEWAILSDLTGNGIRSASSGAPDWQWSTAQKTGTVQLGRQRSPEHESGRFMAPYLRVANVHDGYIDYSDVLTMNFSPSERQIYDLRPGDILLNEGQSLELVGRCAIYDGTDDIYFQNTLVRYRPDALLPEFARAIFKYWLETGEFTRIAKRTTSVAHLGASRFAQMPIPLASQEKQLRIVSTLTAASHRVAQEKANIHKLRLLKQGLMDDLLTGRVRVESVSRAR